MMPKGPLPFFFFCVCVCFELVIYLPKSLSKATVVFSHSHQFCSPYSFTQVLEWAQIETYLLPLPHPRSLKVKILMTEPLQHGRDYPHFPLHQRDCQEGLGDSSEFHPQSQLPMTSDTSFLDQVS